METLKSHVWRYRRLLIAAGIIIMCAGTAFTTPVSVVNWSTLMPLVQKSVTDKITDKAQDVWNQEVKVKLMSGLLNSKAVTLTKYNLTSNLDSMMINYMPTVGSFGKDSSMWERAAMGSVMPVLPSTSLDFGSYQRRLRQTSTLLAGPAQNMSTAGMNTSQQVDAKLRDVSAQARIAAYEQGGEGVYMAESFRKELAAFSPSSFDGATSDQAVKDLAKIMYYNSMLQAQILKVMSREVMKDATVR